MIIRLYRFLILQQKGYLPYVRTSGLVAAKIMKSGVLDGKQKIVDLGCGNGVFLKAVQKKCPSAELVGVEHGWLLVQQARLRFFLRRGLGYQRVKIVHGDMFKFDVSEFDGIVGFWVTDFMPRLLEKFQKETRKDVVILSNLFRLPENDTFTEKKLGTKNRIFYIYTRS